MSQLGFWDWEKRYTYLASKQDLLLNLSAVVPWEEFRPILEKVHQKPRKSNAGRKPIDVVVIFKMLILQRLYNLSDEQLEYQINDRLSFMKFLNLGLEDRVPDGTTVWLFREQLAKQGLVRELFEKFDEYLNGSGYEAKGGQIIDATLVPVPKQHIKKEERKALESGKIPKEWDKNHHKRAQRDQDAQWTRKNNQNYYGYKNHINVDVEHGLIRRYEVSHAAMHDSQKIAELLDGGNEGKGLWGDSAYRKEATERALSRIGFASHINERGYRNRSLTKEQKERNRERSRIRAKVEHVFGGMVQGMGGKMERVIGQVRVSTQIGLKNLAYNLRRYCYLEKEVI